MKVNWGRSGWQFLHTVTFAYPDHPTLLDKKRYLSFFKMIKYILPCPGCRRDFAKVKIDQKSFKNRETLSRWLVAVHNRINVKLGKPVVPYSIIKKRYT